MLQLSRILFRVSLAFPFFYSSIDGLVHPSDWIGYVPHFVSSIMPIPIFLGIFSIIELVLALWVLFGPYAWIPSVLIGFLLLGIVAVNPSQFLVTFRDLSIAGLAFGSAAFLYHDRERKQ